MLKIPVTFFADALEYPLYAWKVLSYIITLYYYKFAKVIPSFQCAYISSECSRYFDSPWQAIPLTSGDLSVFWKSVTALTPRDFHDVESIYIYFSCLRGWCSVKSNFQMC